MTNTQIVLRQLMPVGRFRPVGRLLSVVAKTSAQHLIHDVTPKNETKMTAVTVLPSLPRQSRSRVLMRTTVLRPMPAKSRKISKQILRLHTR